MILKKKKVVVGLHPSPLKSKSLGGRIQVVYFVKSFSGKSDVRPGLKATDTEGKVAFLQPGDKNHRWAHPGRANMQDTYGTSLATPPDSASHASCISVLCSTSSSGGGRKKETRPEWKAFSNFIYNCHSDKK